MKYAFSYRQAQLFCFQILKKESEDMPKRIVSKAVLKKKETIFFFFFFFTNSSGMNLISFGKVQLVMSQGV